MNISRVLSKHILVLIFSMGFLFTNAQVENSEEKLEWVENNLKNAAEQYELLINKVPEGLFPKTYEDGELKTSKSSWWCSGFYPGTLLYLYEATQTPELYEEAERMLGYLEKEKLNTTTHDLGFMMFCSFGNAYKLLGKEKHAEVIKTASHSLSTRFKPKVGVIRSWNSAPWNQKWEYPVIIDNMMNLEMLLWAGKKFNNDKFIRIAQTHADTTLKNHFRQDYSSYHVVSYDTISGQVEMKNTDQGYADESAWARGQAWGLYGYTVMYRFTKEQKYLDQARGIANFILDHPNLPEDKIPYWDFNAPNIPDAKKDASAGAIIASALIELKDYVGQPESKKYLEAGDRMLMSLSSPKYTAKKGENGGFILKHSVGNMPDNTEVDVPLSYADYYYVEALLRYKNQLQKEKR